MQTGVFDLDRGFEFLESDTRFVDKLVKVYQRDGTGEWVQYNWTLRERFVRFLKQNVGE